MTEKAGFLDLLANFLINYAGDGLDDELRSTYQNVLAELNPANSRAIALKAAFEELWTQEDRLNALYKKEEDGEVGRDSVIEAEAKHSAAAWGVRNAIMQALEYALA